MNKEITEQDIIAAVSQAWCTSENSHKEMDVVLAHQIVQNVKLLLEE
jgi:hypothetical protein